MKILIALIIGLFLAPMAMADYDHYPPGEPAATTTVINQGAKSQDIDYGAAMALAAAQHHFDFGTFSPQGSIAAARYGASTVLSLAMGWRPCDTCMLLNGSVGAGTVDGKKALAVGGSWRF